MQYYNVITGTIQEDKLRELLCTMGDRFTDEEVDEMFRGTLLLLHHHIKTDSNTDSLYYNIF